MKLLIDANIILDVLEERPSLVEASSVIWKLCETKEVDGYVSTLTFADIVYIMRKELSPASVKETYEKLSLIFHFVDLTEGDLENAAKLEWNDYEDAVQSTQAERIDADYIVTRNIRDFLKSEVPAFTPEEMMLRIEQ